MAADSGGARRSHKNDATVHQGAKGVQTFHYATNCPRMPSHTTGRAMAELCTRTPPARRTAKSRAVLSAIGVAIKVIALLALVVFLYTAGARNGAHSTVRGGVVVPVDDEDDVTSAAAAAAAAFAPLSSRRADWADAPPPKHCADIRRAPRPFDKGCKRKAGT